MKRIYFFVIAMIAIIAVGIYFLTRTPANQNIGQNITPENNPFTPEIKGFLVEKLPDFAKKDCQDRKGEVKQITERGKTIEKCVFEEKF